MNFKNYMKINKSISRNEKGQVLLFVIITMTVALALGVALSLQTIRSISEVSETDTSKRSLASAEGIAERALVLDDASLSTLVSGDPNACEDHLDGNTIDGECIVTVSDGSENFTSQVKITVEDFPTNSEELILDVLPNHVKEFKFDTFGANDIDVCWDGEPDLYYMVYSESGESYKSIICSNTTTGCDSPWGDGTNSSGLDTTGITDHGYQTCHTVSASNMPTDPVGLRIRNLGGVAAQVELISDTPFPAQGYRIVAEGALAEQPDVVRQVSVIKSFTYLPGIFDFAFYSETNLGN